MKAKKSMALVAAAALCCAVLAGCGDAPKDNASASGEPKKVEIKAKEDLNGLRIGVQEGTTGADYASDDVEGAEVSRYKNAIDAMMDLENGKLDCIIWDELPSKRAVSKRSKLTVIESLELTSEEYSIAVKKGSTELLESINKSIARMKSDGTMDQIAAVYATEAATDQKLPEIDTAGLSGELVMGTNAMFEPFEYRDNNEVVGFDVEMGKQIAKDMGKKLKVEDMDFGGIIAAVQTGKVDIGLAGITANDERRQNVDFSDPYFTAKQVVVVKK